MAQNIRKKILEVRTPRNVTQRQSNAGSGLSGGLDKNSVEGSSEGDKVNFDTVINRIFASNTQRDCSNGLSGTACGLKELPCFFEFTGACSARRAEGDICYGLYCLRHTNATNRTFTVIGSQNTAAMQPIPLKSGACEKNMFLWSFLTKVSYARAKELVSFMNISTEESGQLAKFISAVSEPVGSKQNSEEFQRLSQYLSAYYQSAIKCIESIPDRDKILIPINFSPAFSAQTTGNKLVTDILQNNDLSYQTLSTGVMQTFVPLNMLNILDQINILSFRIYCGVGRIALAPNCSITGDRIYLGAGLSIRNSLNTVDIAKVLQEHPEAMYRLIRSVHGDNVHNNYDVLVMLAVPDSVNSVVNPQLFLAKRKFLVPTFDVDKLDMMSFCI